jgi:phage FluMu protein gp41
MTATADAKRRVYLRAVKPGDRFDVQVAGEGTLVLRRLEPVPEEPQHAKARLVRRNGYTVIHTDKKVSLETIRELLSEFP